jgi:hypothetical protein
MGDERSASTVFGKALRVPNGHYDAAILGGGLAGQTLALQLKRERPDTRILVAEKRAYRPPDAAFKVGESTVEIGAHYYREVCGLREHLENDQIAKAGLRYFFGAGDNGDITKRAEFVTVAKRDADTHQIDRGRFENELYDRCADLGIDTLRGWRVEDLELGDPHKLTLSHEQGQAEVTARWITDATGRANLLRRKLGIGTEVNHHINSAWFRLDGGIDLEDWAGGDEEWGGGGAGAGGARGAPPPPPALGGGGGRAALVDAVRRLGGAAALKWPNDLLVGEKKCAGVLAERVVDLAVVGIGVNVDWRGVPRPDPSWGSLAEELGDDVDRWELLAGLLAALDEALTLAERDPRVLLDTYRRSCVTIGEEVAVEVRDGVIAGLARGVDDDGALLVAAGDRLVHVRAGDVLHVRGGG